jgi:hypothetical protein
MLRVGLHLVIRPLLLAVVASALVNAAAQPASLTSPYTVRLHPHLSTGDAGLPRYTPFAGLTDAQLRAIAVFEYWAFLGADCLCQKARTVSAPDTLAPFP